MQQCTTYKYYITGYAEYDAVCYNGLDYVFYNVYSIIPMFCISCTT